MALTDKQKQLIRDNLEKNVASAKRGLAWTLTQFASAFAAKPAAKLGIESALTAAGVTIPGLGILFASSFVASVIFYSFEFGADANTRSIKRNINAMENSEFNSLMDNLVDELNEFLKTQGANSNLTRTDLGLQTKADLLAILKTPSFTKKAGSAAAAIALGTGLFAGFDVVPSYLRTLFADGTGGYIAYKAAEGIVKSSMMTVYNGIRGLVGAPVANPLFAPTAISPIGAVAAEAGISALFPVLPDKAASSSGIDSGVQAMYGFAGSLLAAVGYGMNRLSGVKRPRPDDEERQGLLERESGNIQQNNSNRS